MKERRAELFIEDGYKISSQEGHSRALLMMRMAYRAGVVTATEFAEELAEHVGNPELLGWPLFNSRTGDFTIDSTIHDALTLNVENVPQYPELLHDLVAETEVLHVAG